VRHVWTRIVRVGKDRCARRFRESNAQTMVGTASLDLGRTRFAALVPPGRLV
jgi:hypothetical protein